ncbi:argininosuccinate lyase [Brevibacillus brevis]|uniref:Argininosuccinate lyase n=1 Tax=Brevibacillus brevis TaxID=1393 RepID=A0ABY9SWX2_BREBE|nr:argininosuccinate lyase [Brevibacillus brevis]WNC12309.1 argininosuccinate lyase [Brevibacillus brevis]
MRLSEVFVNEGVVPTLMMDFHSHRYEMTMMNKAHGLMLVKQGLLDKQSYRKIADGLDKVLNSFRAEDLDGQKGDLYFNLQLAMYQFVGEKVGCQIHLGRSRNDMLGAVYRMETRRALWQVMEHLLSLKRTLLKKAEENLDTVITFYTFGQPAQPGTIAHYYLMLFDALSRDFTRLKAAYLNTNRSPMGAAAGIGTSYPLDRQFVCDLLGFDSVIENSMDSIGSTDYLLEIEMALSLLMSNISKAASDHFFWATDECRTLECGFEVSDGSSIMPQKKNPVALELIRSKSAHCAGVLMDGLMANRNTSMFPNYDSLEARSTFWNGISEATRVLAIFEDVLNYSEVRKEQSYERTKNNFTSAATMAEILSQKYDIPFEDSHHVIGGMIRRLMNQGSLDVKNMTGALLSEVAKETMGIEIMMTDEEVASMMDPLYCLQGKVTGGTPKPADSQKMLTKNRSVLEEETKWLAAAKQQVNSAYERINKSEGSHT